MKTFPEEGSEALGSQFFKINNNVIMENSSEIEERQISAVKVFCSNILKEFRDIIKSIWLLRQDAESSKDLLTIILLDDTKKEVGELLKKKIETKVLEEEENIKKKFGIIIHTSFYLLSDYWNLIKHGSPTVFCEIREGIPIYDPSGFFVPLKKLLLQGKIPGTKEAMRELITNASFRVRRVESLFKIRVLEHLFNAVVEAGQAPLILIGVSPPKPRKVAENLKIHFVRKKLLEPEYAKYCEEIVRYWKKCEHGKIKANWEDIDEIAEKTARFISRMERLVEYLTSKESQEYKNFK